MYYCNKMKRPVSDDFAEKHCRQIPGFMGKDICINLYTRNEAGEYKHTAGITAAWWIRQWGGRKFKLPSAKILSRKAIGPGFNLGFFDGLFFRRYCYQVRHHLLGK